MRKMAFVLISILLGSTQLGQADQFRLGILTSQDIEYQNFTNSNGPVLSSRIDDPNPWESYNQWQCFPSVQIIPVETEIGGHWQRTYLLHANHGNEYFDYDVPLEIEWNFEEVNHDWVRLLTNASEVCILGAFLQFSERNRSLWIIQQIKTANGQWDVES